MLDVDAVGVDIMDRNLLEAVLFKFGGEPVGIGNLVGHHRALVFGAILARRRSGSGQFFGAAMRLFLAAAAAATAAAKISNAFCRGPDLFARAEIAI